MAKKTKTSPSFSAAPARVESPINSVVNPDAPSSDATSAPDPAASPAPDPRERIAARAYERYLQRGGGHGRETEDWLEAEREISGASPKDSDSSGGR